MAPDWTGTLVVAALGDGVTATGVLAAGFAIREVAAALVWCNKDDIADICQCVWVPTR